VLQWVPVASLGLGCLIDSQYLLNAGFSIDGWLAVLFTFLLARVFAVGTLMRDDLEGTSTPCLDIRAACCNFPAVAG